MLGTRLIAPPVTTIVGLLARTLLAAALIYAEVTESIASVCFHKVREP
jgi:CRISPR/Cas system-associated protein Cas5 (RAMP superfamily)